jgi:hypothetical protein
VFRSWNGDTLWRDVSAVKRTVRLRAERRHLGERRAGGRAAAELIAKPPIREAIEKMLAGAPRGLG